MFGDIIGWLVPFEGSVGNIPWCSVAGVGLCQKHMFSLFPLVPFPHFILLADLSLLILCALKYPTKL